MAGVLVLVPIYATVVVFLWLLNIFSGLGDFIPKEIHPTEVFPYPGVGLIWNLFLASIMLFLVAITGLLSKNFLFFKVLNIFEDFINRLPFLRSVYSGIRQVLAASFGQSSKNFSRVLLVEWPHQDMWTIAFVTSTNTPAEIGLNTTERYISVYVPTTPNPTGGYWVMVKESQTKPCNLSVEDAFKTLLSLGISQETND